MKKRKPGNKYRFIIYQNKWSYLWKLTLALGAVMGFAWWHASMGRIPIIPPPRDAWLFIGSAVSIFFSLVALAASRLHYVQVFPNYIKIVTPFLRMNISYRRIKSVRPVDLKQLFPPIQQKSSIFATLEPYYGITSAGIEMTSYPVDEKMLHLFLPKEMFLPHTKGLVLVIRDWLAFSTEFDTYKASYIDRKTGKKPSSSILSNLKYK